MEFQDVLIALSEANLAVQRMTLIFFAQESEELAGENSKKYEDAFCKAYEMVSKHWKENQQ